MANPRSFNLAATILTLGGERITGTGDSNLIDFEVPQDIWEIFFSGDGQTSYFASNINTLTSKVTLHQLSYGNVIMKNVLKSQAVGGLLIPVSATFFDPASGSTISTSQAVLTTFPGPKFGKSNNNLEYGLAWTDAMKTWQLNENIVRSV